MNAYWRRRWTHENDAALRGVQGNTIKSLQRVYLATAEKLIDKMLARFAVVSSGAGIPNDAYQLKRDAALLKQITAELDKLGYDTSDLFGADFKNVYQTGDKIADKFIASIKKIPTPVDHGNQLYTKINEDSMMRSIYAVNGDDGKNWSQRLWGNIGGLQAVLESDMSRAVATGESAMTLASRLMNDFSVSFAAAKRIAVTEMTRIFNLAALDRMARAGIEMWEWYTAEDEKVCKACRELDGKKFPITCRDVPPIASHPNCRCTILADI